VDQIDAGVLPNSSANRLVIRIKFRAQCSEESIDVGLGHGDHHVHVQRRPGLTGNRAGNRPADKVQHAAGLKCVRHLKRDLNKAGRHTGGPRI
jgi:hypothetical protein